MRKERAPEIIKLQDNLPSLRRLAGWTAADLGEKVGVTKQTISNLETGRIDMTKMQYIAIRTVLEYEAKTHDNKNLEQAMHLVLDDIDSSKAQQAENEQKVKAAAAAATEGVGDEILADILGVVASMAFIGITSWLSKIIDKNT